MRQDGPDKATALVRDEIDDVLATLDVAHRQQLAVAVERTRFGRNGIYDVTVRRGTEIVAEFRGRSRMVGEV